MLTLPLSPSLPPSLHLSLSPSLPLSLPPLSPCPSVRSIPNETYLCSISIPDSLSPYISCIVTTTTVPDGKGRGEKLRVCTGGNELKVWDVTPARKLPGTEE